MNSTKCWKCQNWYVTSSDAVCEHCGIASPYQKPSDIVRLEQNVIRLKEPGKDSFHRFISALLKTFLCILLLPAAIPVFTLMLIGYPIGLICLAILTIYVTLTGENPDIENFFDFNRNSSFGIVIILFFVSLVCSLPITDTWARWAWSNGLDNILWGLLTPTLSILIKLILFLLFTFLIFRGLSLIEHIYIKIDFHLLLKPMFSVPKKHELKKTEEKLLTRGAPATRHTIPNGLKSLDERLISIEQQAVALETALQKLPKEAREAKIRRGDRKAIENETAKCRHYQWQAQVRYWWNEFEHLITQPKVLTTQECVTRRQSLEKLASNGDKHLNDPTSYCPADNDSRRNELVKAIDLCRRECEALIVQELYIDLDERVRSWNSFVNLSASNEAEYEQRVSELKKAVEWLEQKFKEYSRPERLVWPRMSDLYDQLKGIKYEYEHSISILNAAKKEYIESEYERLFDSFRADQSHTNNEILPQQNTILANIAARQMALRELNLYEGLDDTLALIQQSRSGTSAWNELVDYINQPVNEDTSSNIASAIRAKYQQNPQLEERQKLSE